MRKLCLDTDFLVALLRGHKEAVEKAKEYDSAEAEVSTTSVNAFVLEPLGLGRLRETLNRQTASSPQ